MADLRLETQLVADAGQLNAALRTGAQGVREMGQAANESNKAQAAAANASTAALQAQQAAMQSARAAANQTRQAYRQLPAQITDVVTSLASGQPAWLVAIQQGGQIKDSFGGAGSALQALTSLVSPARLALGGLAATAGAVALAYNQGAAEAQAYMRAIITSGNAAGVTRTQLAGMAREIDKVVGTEALAADALAQVVATGQVTSRNVQEVATVAILMQREMGVAIKDTVADFAALGRDPVQASIRLNQQTNFLTVEIYEQIKALEKRGEIERAAELAQRTYASAQKERTDELNKQLGSIERAARDVVDGAKKMWDAILGVGRKSDLAKELATAEIALANLNNPNRRSQDPRRDAQTRESVTARIAALREQIDAEAEAAAVAQSSAERTERHIKTEKDREAATKAAADAYQQLKQSIAEKLAQSNEELRLGTELTQAQRAELDMKLRIAEAEGKIGKARADELRRDAAAAAAAAARVQAQRDASAAGTADVEARRSAGEAAAREADSLERSNEAMRREVDALGLEGQALLAVEQARLSSAIALKEEQLARLEGLQIYTLEEDALRRQIEALRTQQGLLGERQGRRERLDLQKSLERQAEQEREADRRRIQALADSIEQGILQGARDGRSIMSVFARELEAQFARVVLRPIVSPIAEQAGGLINQLLGMAVGYFTGGGAGSARIPSGAGPLPPLPGFTPGGGAATGTNFVERDMLTILHKGEAVVPKAFNPAAGGVGGTSAPVNITVINQTGTQAQATTRRRSDGGIEVLLQAVKDSIASDIAGGQGPVTGALRGRFGLRDSMSTA